LMNSLLDRLTNFQPTSNNQLFPLTSSSSVYFFLATYLVFVTIGLQFIKGARPAKLFTLKLIQNTILLLVNGYVFVSLWWRDLSDEKNVLQALLIFYLSRMISAIDTV